MHAKLPHFPPKKRENRKSENLKFQKPRFTNKCPEMVVRARSELQGRSKRLLGPARSRSGVRNGCSSPVRSRSGARNGCSSPARSSRGARNGCDPASEPQWRSKWLLDLSPSEPQWRSKWPLQKCRVLFVCCRYQFLLGSTLFRAWICTDVALVLYIRIHFGSR